MLPLTRSRNRARFFGIPFSPSALFQGGTVAGAWYDPSDYSTLFTDSAGTTPVTAVEQFVGLMLDKSKGLVLGSERVTNGTFDANLDGWTTTGSTPGYEPTWDAGTVLIVRDGSGDGRLNQSAVFVVGRFYRMTFDVVNSTTGATVFIINGVSTAVSTSVGTKTYQFFAAGTGLQIRISGTVTVNLDNISVRELPGNHAFQTNSLKRPKLAARYNLLTYSEEFDNAVWTKTNLNTTGTPAWVNVAVAPDGTTTAERFIEDTGTVSPSAVQLVNFAFSATQSYYVKPNGRTWVYLQTTYVASIPVANRRVWFNLSGAGSVGTIGSEYSNPTIVALNNGWYRISAAINPAASGTSATNTVIGIGNADNSASYTGDGTSGIYIWGADLRPASQATGLIGPTYQRVAAATVYDTAGFLPYLAFDGLDDSMSTNSIDFSAGDKMTVWAGVRKLSDATAFAVIAEGFISARRFTFHATFNTNTPTYDFSSGGSITVSATATGYAAPSTNVLTGIGDISSDVAVLRVNASQAAINTGDQGTGNYPNVPLYIGARTGASQFFNGWLTSLIVRGAQSTQSQIEATEAWVAGKTGVQL